MEDARLFVGRDGVGEDACRVAVIYSDTVSRDAAIEVVDRLFIQFHWELSFDSSWWGFKYLGHAKISSQAAKAITQADLLLVSIASGQEIPIEMKAWFERHLPRQQRASAALGLLETPRQAGLPSAAARYFEDFTSRTGLDFLCVTADASPTPLSTRSIDDVSEGGCWRQPIEERYHSTGWGINE